MGSATSFRVRLLIIVLHCIDRAMNIERNW